jgi:hypothetical protein
MGASEVRRVSRAEWRAYRATVRARYRENLKAHVLGQVAVSLTIGLLTGLIALLSGAGLSSAGFAVGGTGLYVLGAAAFYKRSVLCPRLGSDVWGVRTLLYERR